MKVLEEDILWRKLVPNTRILHQNVRVFIKHRRTIEELEGIHETLLTLDEGATPQWKHWSTHGSSHSLSWYSFSSVQHDLLHTWTRTNWMTQVPSTWHVPPTMHRLKQKASSAHGAVLMWAHACVHKRPWDKPSDKVLYTLNKNKNAHKMVTITNVDENKYYKMNVEHKRSR